MSRTQLAERRASEYTYLGQQVSQLPDAFAVFVAAEHEAILQTPTRDQAVKVVVTTHPRV